jgi:hypothetical protein
LLLLLVAGRRIRPSVRPYDWNERRHITRLSSRSR